MSQQELDQTKVARVASLLSSSAKKVVVALQPPNFSRITDIARVVRAFDSAKNHEARHLALERWNYLLMRKIEKAKNAAEAIKLFYERSPSGKVKRLCMERLLSFQPTINELQDALCTLHGDSEAYRLGMKRLLSLCRTITELKQVLRSISRHGNLRRLIRDGDERCAYMIIRRIYELM